METTTQNGRVPLGIYRGAPWSDVPLNYLFYVVNNHGGAFSRACRREVIRRRQATGEKPVDPWASDAVTGRTHRSV